MIYGLYSLIKGYWALWECRVASIGTPTMGKDPPHIGTP